MPELTAHQDTRLNRPSGIRSIQLGDTKVSYVPDGDVRLRPLPLLPDTTDEVWAAHPEYLDANGHLVASVGALLVEHGGRALLIDAGFGPQTYEAPDGPLGVIHGGALPQSLAELGRTPRDIEAVAFTHLHSDHLGWAFRPEFAHTEYLVAEPEWAGRDDLESQEIVERVAALAPRVRTVTDGQEVFPGVTVRITPGHTVGHAEYVITGGGRRLIAFGDAVHSPIQIDRPDWSSAFDHDLAATAGHRRRLVAELAEPGTIGFGIHFADVVFGHVRHDGDGPAWKPLDA
ncbi:MBL fold metallo-hydrolase [Streptomyces sp. NBC_00249]|uniref:MBL fold metallo-hydrolase n=1 Tax=Streptomyces sp. NBC_00249 TaxID=2975690 RepID=UPI002251D01A|nr:MBL fold metallo-hydrolase [Streptomyces sp. NBC_00249]MCX5194771.1 MBL fold metallo-hydrolase [Streptomyces sp. NBC_00249]